MKRSCGSCGKEISKRWSSKFCNHTCHKKFIHDQYVKKWLAGTVNATQQGGLAISRHVKTWLENKFGRKCSKCKLITWLKQPIPLIVDHIDGDATRSTHDNVRLVCPNCDMLSPTWGGRNRGNGRESRRLMRNTPLKLR